jgi:hypothetical protein
MSFNYKTGAKNEDNSTIKVPKNKVLEEIDIGKTQVIHNTTDKTRGNKKRQHHSNVKTTQNANRLTQ